MPSKSQLDRAAVLALPDDALLTPEEISVLLSLHVATVVRLCSKGRLPAFPLPLSGKRRTWRAHKRDILAIGAPTPSGLSSSAQCVPVHASKGDSNGKHG